MERKVSLIVNQGKPSYVHDYSPSQELMSLRPIRKTIANLYRFAEFVMFSSTRVDR